jgi:hypothetical protein
MKIRYDNNRLKRDRGSALAVTLLTSTILASMVGSYFYLIQAQCRSVARSQRWNQALVVAEGGIEEALALLNSGVQAGNFAIFPWTGGCGVFQNDPSRPASKFGDRYGDSYYEVFITNAFAGANPVIISRGHVPGPLGTLGLTRTVRVEAHTRPTFPVKGPMIVLESFDAKGGNVTTDSFDSSLGAYNPATAGTNGDVVTLTTNALSIQIGNGTIKGIVRTPPGGTLGPGGTATILGGTIGGFEDDFLQTEFPDATLPNVGAFLPPLGGMAPDGLHYDYLLPGGNYQVDTLTGSVYVGATNTVLYVTGSISIGSGGNKKGDAPPQIHIAPGASVTVYMAGATASIAGNGVVNDTGMASAFAYYGLPTNTRLDLTGNGAFYGTIYAPQADFNLKGSGKGSADDFTGASITKTTTMTGNFNFHYDESLIYLTTLGGYDAVSWEEM